jgi:filamentous hemagglutinin family protein
MGFERARRAAALLTASSALAASAAQLPVPCLTGSCGSSSNFVSAGTASAAQSGNQLTITQTSNSATLNWQSFNISSDGAVRFQQPGTSAVALNRIFDANPSQISGSLTANGTIYLINRNGIVFGNGAQVNVGSLVASSLNLSADALQGGIASAIQNGNPAFVLFTDPVSGSALPSGPVTVALGATIQTSTGGQVLMFAPTVTNLGTIQTPGGQAILAAGSPVYLENSTDPNLRGLLVEVGVGGTVTNGNAQNATVASAAQLAGQIIAEGGNITLAGLAVNQDGRVMATTTINENGSIRLQARSNPNVAVDVLQPGTGGTLTLGPNSDTEVALATSDPSTTVDSVAQPKSRVELAGATIDVLGGSSVAAKGGAIDVLADTNQSPEIFSAQQDASRFYLAPDATLDVSGAQVTLPASSNIIAVQLRGTELADSALQRNGVLRGQTVYVDSRLHGTRADGTTWVGTPLGDVSGEVAAIQRNVAERNLDGGAINIQSQGDVILAPQSVVNVAGGAINYAAGNYSTTKLLTASGQVVDIGSADPNVVYAGIVSANTLIDPKWNLSGVPVLLPGNNGTYQNAYVQGMDAGTLAIATPRFILDGTIDGAATAGYYQRQPESALPAYGALYHYYDQFPQAAGLVLGVPGGQNQANYLLGNVGFGAAPVLMSLQNADRTAFDPLIDPWPVAQTTSLLRPELLQGGQVGSLTVASNGQLLLPAGDQITLPADGSLTITARAIDIEGTVEIPAGSVILNAVSTNPGGQGGTPPGNLLQLGTQGILSVAGAWINDSAALNPGGPSAPIAIRGGSVALSASSGKLLLDAGSVIDVSGGGYLSAQGKLTAGAGGSLSIIEPAAVNGAANAPQVLLDAQQLGYGISSGGSLALNAGTVCIAASDCSGGDPATTWLAPSFFTQGGFGSYRVASSVGGLTVSDGTQVALYQLNYQLPGNVASLASAPTLRGLASPTLLAAVYRTPTNLSLSAHIFSNGQPISDAALLQLPLLQIGAGALIAADPGATLSLASNTRLIDDGTLRAPGGQINLTLRSNLNIETDLPSQVLWLGPTSLIDAGGVAQIVLNSVGLRSGTVLNGGSVTVTADNGFIEMLPGAEVNVAGTAATLDFVPASLGSARAGASPTLVASAGGSVAFTAAEGLSLEGSFSAGAGSAAAGAREPAGGSLTVTLDAGQRGDPIDSSTFNSLLNAQARTIVLTQAAPGNAPAEGGTLAADQFGYGYVGATPLMQGGFASVALQAHELQGTQASSSIYVPGVLDYSGTVALTLPQQIGIDAGTLAASGAAAGLTLTAPYVSIGNSSSHGLQGGYEAAAPSAGSGSLSTQAGFLDLYGSLVLQGIGSASFDSTGDIQLRGVEQQIQTSLATQQSLAASITGGIASLGNVSFTAQQLYPTTLANFRITTDPATGLIKVTGAPGSRDSVLSAGGVLTFSAASIEQDGVIEAPLGTIVMDSAQIVLGATSVTSTSAQGLTIPFGSTQGGIDWTYPLLYDSAAVIYGSDGQAPPAQRIALNGNQITLQTGALIDVAGGGDLQAYEFVPGVGGTQDVLGLASANHEYAIVPSLHLATTPYDQQLMAGWNLAPGASVHLSAAPGLPAGDYVLLPARYALLPGAFLVSPVAGYQGLAAGAQIAQTNGSTIVSGYLNTSGTVFASSTTSGFAVLPGQDVLQQAQYTSTSGNQFFAAQAASAGSTVPRLPQDAGLLSLAATDQLVLDATLNGQSASGGLGAGVDISSAQIEIVADAAAPASPGVLELTASALDQLGAQSLLIGGHRDGTTLSIDAQSVSVDAGAALRGPELLLAGEAVSVAGGATVTAGGAAPAAERIDIAGNGALLRVSAGAQAALTPAPGSTQGSLMLQSGSTLSASGGSVYVYAPGGASLAGTLSIGNADLAVNSLAINLGVVPAGTAGTTLSGASLAALGLHDLLLASPSSVNFFGTFSTQVQSLTLDSPLLQGEGAAGDTAAIAVSGTLALTNTFATAAAPSGGQGALGLSAGTIQFTGGSVATAGFGAVALSSGGAIQAIASSGLQAGSDLALGATQLGTGQASELTLGAAGAFSLLTPAGTPAPAAVSDIGGIVSVTAASVDLGGRILVPGGTIAVTATGLAPGDGVSLGSGALLDVSGTVRQFDGVNVAAPAGTINVSSSGALTIQSGATLNVSAAAGGAAGSLSLSAPNGSIQLTGAVLGQGQGTNGASVSLDAQSFGDFNALTQQLNAGGFTATRIERLRGAAGGDNDIALGADPADVIRAQQVTLIADQGAITVAGTIDVSGSSGGVITLEAANGIRVAGQLLAGSSGAGARGGQINVLAGAGGPLQLQPGSILDVSAGAGGAGGQILLRVPRSAFNQTTPVGLSVGGSLLGASQTTVEAYQVYTNTTGSLGASDVAASLSNPLYADAAGFMLNAPAITQALGQSANSSFVLVPGIEIDSPGKLTLTADWNLYGWRFGGNAGVLTLRSAGALQFGASLSDGFTSTASFTLPSVAAPSWSYRLVAGADLSSAAPLAISQLPADLLIAPGVVAANLRNPDTHVMVRTGTGFIDAAASGDFVLGNQASVLYTAGVAGPGIPISGRGNGSLQGLAYPIHGGDIALTVAGNIDGAPSNQFVTAWLWRSGRPATATNPLATGWTVNFADFSQGIGALAGGNVTVQAGGSITNFSASIPTIGVQTGGTTPAASVVAITGGGNLSVAAGGSVLGGSYYAGNGAMQIRAGADIGAPDPGGAGASGLAPLLGLGGGSITAIAGGNLTLAGIVNPTLLPEGAPQGGTVPSYFSTYTPDAAVTLTAVGGDLSLPDQSIALSQVLTTMNWTGLFATTPLEVMPPTLQATALNGNLDVGGSLDLFPSAAGTLQLFADQNVIANTSSGAVQVFVSDADPALLGTAAVPVTSVATLGQAYQISSLASSLGHAAVPVHATTESTVRIVALTGDVSFPNHSDDSLIYSAEPVRIVAGRDILDVPLEAQDLQSSDVTSLMAGRDIVYSQARSALGYINPSQRVLQVDGPGALQLIAGRNVNLGTSLGITTTGNLVNSALAAGGAQVSVLAGVGAQPPQYASFITTYIDDASTYDAELIAYVQGLTGGTGLSAQDAKAAFHLLSADLQAAFARTVFIAELRAGGRAAAAAGAGNGNFARAFAALTTLFPGANPSLAEAQTNPYLGNIELYFSRIYTLSGGDVTLLAPGGEINVGLAQAPAAFGIDKSPSQLGIVAQGVGDLSAVAYNDFQVNQSRVFAADGGNILVWSTEGNIDAGRGAKTAISAPPPIITTDQNGRLQVTFPNVLTGSGIQTLATTAGVLPGDVDLFAPHGVVNANDAGIVAGNLTIAATAVLGSSNISVSGTSVGVPVAAEGIGASLAGSSGAAAAAAASTAQNGLGAPGANASPATPLADSALSWIEVFVTGLGTENCKPEDLECLKRQKTGP